jgi:pimeloyl-ACP methyl ester carboxylesterase
MRHDFVTCVSDAGYHRMAYTEWGSPDAERVLICVHGLTRTGRDFDFLAAALQDRYRVVCPDIAGRGASDWLRDPSLYNNLRYVDDVTALIARLGVKEVDWLGTSMGGLIGMFAAAFPGTPIRRMIINDVGPLVPKAALERIASYVGLDPRFKDMWQAGRHIREAYAPFGRKLTEAQWDHLARHSVRALDEGGFALTYDPAIAQPFQQGPIEAVDLWPVWDAIDIPTLLLRGAETDLLLPETAEEMTERGPKAKLIEFDDCGHAPSLMEEHQIDTIRHWLLGEDA